MPKVIDDEKVFQAVVDVLVAHGYKNATTKNIAKGAGMHEATLFRKYGSKFKLIDRAIAAQFLDVPLARLRYTGDLRGDLLSIIEAYFETSEMVGDILPILLAEIPRNPELKDSLETPWKNMFNIASILEKYQARGMLKKEPVLTSLSVLIGPLMVRHMLERANLEMPLPEIDPQEYVNHFLSGRLI